MGAQSFSRIGRGRTAEQAFETLRSSDEAEYGHDPYTGDIGQKSGFSMIRVAKPMTDKQAFALLREKFHNETPIRKGSRVEVDFYDFKNRREVRFVGTVLAKRGATFRVQPDGAYYATAKPDPVTVAEHDLEPERDPSWDRFQDKWDPTCGCIPLTKKWFLFFGWAAS